MFQQQEAWGVYRQEMGGKKGNISNRMCSKKMQKEHVQNNPGMLPTRAWKVTGLRAVDCWIVTKTAERNASSFELCCRIAVPKPYFDRSWSSVQIHFSCSMFFLEKMIRAGPFFGMVLHFPNLHQSSPVATHAQGFALKASPPAAPPTPLRPAMACCIARMTMMWFANGPWRQGKSFAALTIEVAMLWSTGLKSTCSHGQLGSSEMIWIAQKPFPSYVSLV